MAQEIEKKYLVKYLPEELKKLQKNNLLQGYIHIDKEKQVRVRVNLTNKTAKMCIKYMGEIRDEFESNMDYEEGLVLFSRCEYKLCKDRISYWDGEKHIDIDFYQDRTIIVEIEIPSLDYKYVIPDWIGECVDGQYRYNNYYYAGLPEEDY